LDEVVLVPNNFYPVDLGERFGFNPRELVQTAGIGDALKNKTDLADVLARFPATSQLPREEIQRIVEHDWPKAEGVVDYEVLDHVLNLKAQGLIVAAATNNFKQKCEYIQNSLLPNVFDFFFSSSGLGHLKPAPEFFSAMLKELQAVNGLDDLLPGEIVFFDDKQEYVEAACNEGIDGRIYTQPQQVRRLAHEYAYTA